MTGKSDAGVVIPAALDAGEISCRSVCLASCLSPLSLCLSLLCEWLFKAGQAFPYSPPPSRLVWGYRFPRCEVDIHGLQVPFEDIFISQLGSACRAFALCQLTVEEILGGPAVVHAYHMPQPTHASLLQQCVHAEDYSSLQDVVVCDFVLPDNVQYVTETAHVERIKLLFLSGSQGQLLTAVQESADGTGSVDLDFGVLSQLAVRPYSLC